MAVLDCLQTPIFLEIVMIVRFKRRQSWKIQIFHIVLVMKPRWPPFEDGHIEDCEQSRRVYSGQKRRNLNALVILMAKPLPKSRADPAIFDKGDPNASTRVACSRLREVEKEINVERTW